MLGRAGRTPAGRQNRLYFQVRGPTGIRVDQRTFPSDTSSGNHIPGRPRKATKRSYKKYAYCTLRPGTLGPRDHHLGDLEGRRDHRRTPEQIVADHLDRLEHVLEI